MSKTHKIRIGTAIAVGLALAGTTVPGSAAEVADRAARAPQVPATASPDGDEVVVQAPDPDVSPRSVRDYWTPERMEEAIPLDLGADGELLSPRDDGRSIETARAAVKVPRTTGKLFFSSGLLDYVCSAASIKTRKRNQVITAGHCVHEGDGGAWFDNFVFVPRYRNGDAPLGKWVGNGAWAFNGWINNGSFKYDQAIIQFKKKNGRKLVNRIGGNEVKVDQGVRHRGVRIWGWPAEAPYDGETPHRCDGKTNRLGGSGDAKMSCDMTGGSSGGPWMLKKNRTTHTGLIFAVTSRRTLDGPAYLIARPFPNAVKGMIRDAN